MGTQQHLSRVRPRRGSLSDYNVTVAALAAAVLVALYGLGATVWAAYGLATT